MDRWDEQQGIIQEIDRVFGKMAGDHDNVFINGNARHHRLWESAKQAILPGLIKETKNFGELKQILAEIHAGDYDKEDYSS